MSSESVFTLLKKPLYAPSPRLETIIASTSIPLQFLLFLGVIFLHVSLPPFGIAAEILVLCKIYKMLFATCKVHQRSVTLLICQSTLQAKSYSHMVTKSLNKSAYAEKLISNHTTDFRHFF